MHYDPELDPFRKEDGSSNRTLATSFHSNPVDLVILRLIRSFGRRLRNLYTQGHSSETATKNARLEKSLIEVLVLTSLVLELRLIPALVRSFHERSTVFDWVLHTHQRIRSATLWASMLQLSDPRLLGLVPKFDSPRMSNICS